MRNPCETDSLIPIWVTVVFSAFSMIMIMFTIIVSTRHLKNELNPKRNSPQPTTINISTNDTATLDELDPFNNPKRNAPPHPNNTRSAWEEAACCKKVKWVAKDVWGRKATYLPIVGHLADTATDIASIIEFYLVARAFSAEDCGGLNVWYLFYFSIGCIVSYRAISAFKIYQITNGSLKRTIFQLLDVELYHVLYFSHRFGLKSTSSPHRLISVLEAVFEAAPQSVIQLVYLLHTRNASTVVFVSTLFSFLNLTLSITSDDRKMFGVEFILPCDDVNDHSKKYFLLYFFRILDVPSKLLLFALIWYMVSGFICFGVLALDLIIGIFLYHQTRNTDALLSVVAMPFSFGNEDFKSLVIRYWKWSVVEILFVLIFVWIYSTIPYGNIFNSKRMDIIVLWSWCNAAFIMKLCIGYALKQAVKPSFSETKEKADLPQLLKEKKWNDALEIILFSHPNISDAASKTFNGNSLLYIAVNSQNNKAIFAVSQEGLDKNIKPRGRETELMAAIKENRTSHVEYITRSPQIDLKYLNECDVLTKTAFWHVISGGDLKAMRLLMECLHHLANKEQHPLSTTSIVHNIRYFK